MIFPVEFEDKFPGAKVQEINRLWYRNKTNPDRNQLKYANNIFKYKKACIHTTILHWQL